MQANNELINHVLEPDSISLRDTLKVSEHELKIKKQLEGFIDKGKYVIIDYNGKKRFVYPLSILLQKTIWKLKAKDQIELNEQFFDIAKIQTVKIESTPFLYQEEDQIAKVYREKIDFAYQNSLYVKIKYFKNSGKASTRTISNFQRKYSGSENEWWYSKDSYVRCYCHLRYEERTFRFDRIHSLVVLNFPYDI